MKQKLPYLTSSHKKAVKKDASITVANADKGEEVDIIDGGRGPKTEL